jgi:hypothetical protein
MLLGVRAAVIRIASVLRTLVVVITILGWVLAVVVVANVLRALVAIRAVVSSFAFFPVIRRRSRRRRSRVGVRLDRWSSNVSQDTQNAQRDERQRTKHC